MWSTTWANDDALYSVSDDTTGFDQACSSNLAVNRIVGDRPCDLDGKTVNAMSGYGQAGAFLDEDGGMWKANGLTCVDGVLYLAVSRHGNNEHGPFFVQETWDASIVKSDDHGATWSPMPVLGGAMFPGHSFSTPFFVHYGQDGQGTADDADTYVYAVSSDGVWNNGSAMTLGRVRRECIGRLHPADWTFVQRLDGDGQPVWGARHDTAQAIFRAPGRTSMTGLHYIAPLGLYILPQWHYPRLADPDRARRWTATRWEFYQAPAPWGPWQRFHVQDWEPQGFYNPCLPAKFISADGRRLWLFTAGEFARGAYYHLHTLEMVLEVEP